MTVKVYVEGGGDRNKALKTLCRKGFSEFFQKLGLTGRMPRIIACGGRRRAYDDFRIAHESAGTDAFPVLLVDSEGPVTKSPWEHVRDRSGDGWTRPPEASDDQLHLMVQAMEAWFHADTGALEEYYGQGFPKGEHSFDILARIDPAKVRTGAPKHVERLCVVLDRICR